MRSLEFKNMAAAALAFTVMAAWSGAVSATDYMSSVVATGLNNPRGLSFGLDGALYIAEAGVNTGSGPSTVTRGVLFTYTQSGSVTRYAQGAQSREEAEHPHAAQGVTAREAIASGLDGAREKVRTGAAEQRL